MEIDFKLNQKPARLKGDGERKLLWVLRSDFGLTGTKCGCGMGLCGACTVLINLEAFRSCQVPIKDIKGKEILTIEGLAENGRLHPLQNAFMEANAFQCGFCTPGMILNACSLLLKNPRPSEKEIIREMNDNLCRCGVHQRIVQAIQIAAPKMNGVKR